MEMIEFRAYRLDTGEMVYPNEEGQKYEFEIGLDGDFIVTDRTGLQLQSEKWVIMLCTGLRDKNRKKIYNKDILANPDFSYSDLHKGINNRAVEYSDGEYILCLLYSFTYKLNEYYRDLEVIGNTFQNPELIGDTKR